MDDMDKAKLKVLIKMILIVNRPKELTARQIPRINFTIKTPFIIINNTHNLSSSQFFRTINN